MKRLLILTAVIEASAGLALLIAPSETVELLFGSTLAATMSADLVRLVGPALLTLGLANWIASRHAQSPSALGVVAGMTLYNIGVAILLGAAGVWHRPAGVLLWPAVGLHLAMTVWCIWSVLTQGRWKIGSENRAEKGAHL